MIAYARSRQGDAVGARAMAASVVEQLEALGHPEFAMLHEPDIWPALVRLLEGNSASMVVITLLGGFGIEIDGADVTLPAGRPAQMVKVLALAGRPIPVDELIEILWPDTPTDVGRRRLRNVLARVRAAGPLLDRSEGVLALVPTAVVDCQRFEQLARAAFTAAADLQLCAAEQALDVYAGELLPGDRFEEWSVAPRERMQRRAIRVLGQIVDGASGLGDVDRAVHAADQLRCDRIVRAAPPRRPPSPRRGGRPSGKCPDGRASRRRRYHRARRIPAHFDRRHPTEHMSAALETATHVASRPVETRPVRGGRGRYFVDEFTISACYRLTGNQDCPRRRCFPKTGGFEMAQHKWVGAACALSVMVAACGRDSKSSDSSPVTTAAVATTAAASATSAPTSAAVATTAVATTGGAGASDTAVPPKSSIGGSSDTTPATTSAPTTEAPTTTAAKADPCAGVALKATETGVSADTITVVVMADVGSELAPGLFQGSIDGTKAWAKAVNAAGGLGCRQVQVEQWDSKLSPTESTNGFLEACSKALALVGSTSLFIGDVSIINTCPDAAGVATGIPDIAERAVDAQHQCSPNLFTVAGIGGSCPYPGTGTRNYQVQIGPYNQYKKIAGTDLHGITLIPADLPSTIQSSMPGIRGLNAIGYVSDGEFGVSGRSEQAVYAEYVAAIQAKKSNIVFDGSNDQAMIKMRTEAVAQGLDQTGVIWACSLACYTKAYLDDPVSNGTYIWLPFLPFEERAQNTEVDTFLKAIGNDFPPSWAVGAWNSGRALEVAINKIVATDGPNAITRAKVLATMRTITDFDSNKWVGTVDFSKKALSPCFVLMHVETGKYVRVYPTAKATLDCSPNNLTTWTGDAAAEFKG